MLTFSAQNAEFCQITGIMCEISNEAPQLQKIFINEWAGLAPKRRRAVLGDVRVPD